MFMEKKPYAALVPLFVAALAASAALALLLKPLWVGLLSAALVVACFFHNKYDRCARAHIR